MNSMCFLRVRVADTCLEAPVWIVVETGLRVYPFGRGGCKTEHGHRCVVLKSMLRGRETDAAEGDFPEPRLQLPHQERKPPRLRNLQAHLKLSSIDPLTKIWPTLKA